MNYKLQTLSNGLRVLTVPMPNLESATVTVWVKTGSRNEEEKVGGISHFLEHMVFKGSKRGLQQKRFLVRLMPSGESLTREHPKIGPIFILKRVSEILKLLLMS